MSYNIETIRDLFARYGRAQQGLYSGQYRTLSVLRADFNSALSRLEEENERLREEQVYAQRRENEAVAEVERLRARPGDDHWHEYGGVCREFHGGQGGQS